VERRTRAGRTMRCSYIFPDMLVCLGNHKDRPTGCYRWVLWCSVAFMRTMNRIILDHGKGAESLESNYKTMSSAASCDTIDSDVDKGKESR
jgi:hypothetical protein